MDFKKAYEDALEREKCIYNENPSSSTAKFVCGKIFPEISLHERIRGCIETVLTDACEQRFNDFGVSLKQCLSWLERKKEQQPAECSDAERKQLYSDGYYSSRSNLALDFMHYIDEYRPKGKMCLSNGECAQLDNAFKDGDVETIVRYIIKYQRPAGWSGEDESDMKDIIKAVEEVWDKDDANRMIRLLKSIRPALKPSEGRQPSKPQLAEGVYYIKDSQPVSEYEDGVETDRLLVIGRYCRFYLSMTDLGIANYKEAQNKAASLGEGWRCPDSFEGRTIGKMSKEIREKAAKIGAEHFKEKGWFWTNEPYDRWYACGVSFGNGSVGSNHMGGDGCVLALSAFQN